MTDDAIPAHGWKCNNCQTVFTSTQTERKEGDDNGGPNCPYCKAHGQYTYPYRLHQGDPCTGCGIAHDDVPPGPCVPTPTAAIVTGSDERAREALWRPFAHQRDVPTDGTWFVARSTKPGWAATRVVRYADKSDRLPTDGTGWVWPSVPMEWMPLDDFAALAASSPTDAGVGELTEKAHNHVRSGDYRMGYLTMCEAYGMLATSKPPVDEAMREASAWLRAISDWLLTNDHDMALPNGALDTDPLDIADRLDAAIRNLTGDGAGA